MEILDKIVVAPFKRSTNRGLAVGAAGLTAQRLGCEELGSDYGLNRVDRFVVENRVCHELEFPIHRLCHRIPAGHHSDRRRQHGYGLQAVHPRNLPDWRK